MAWTETTRRQYRREGLRYASDMTDGEWALVAPLMPEPNRLGRPRKTDLQAVVNTAGTCVSLPIRPKRPWRIDPAQQGRNRSRGRPPRGG
jgi:transposase